jgi:Arc/MetJ-type ribon-helix-helix transcriptional regulator
MKTITVKLPEYLVKAIDRLVEVGVFYSRSDAVREAVRMLMDKYYNSGDVHRVGSKSAMVVVVARR